MNLGSWMVRLVPPLLLVAGAMLGFVAMGGVSSEEEGPVFTTSIPNQPAEEGIRGRAAVESREIARERTVAPLGQDSKPAKATPEIGGSPALAEELDRLSPPEACQALERVASDMERTLSRRRELETIVKSSDRDPSLRSLALWGLARAGILEPAHEALSPFYPTGVRLTAVEMLRRHGGPQAAGRLAELARSPGEPSVREAALLSTADLDPESSVEIAREVLADRDSRRLARTALEVLGRSEHHESLAILLDYEVPPGDGLTSLTLAATISRLSSLDRETSAQAVQRILDDPGLPAGLRPQIEEILLGITDPDLASTDCGHLH